VKLTLSLKPKASLNQKPKIQPRKPILPNFQNNLSLPKGDFQAWLLFGDNVGSSEKDSTCILPFVHPNVPVITCSSYMWPEMHVSPEEFTWFLYDVRTPLVIASHNLLSRRQKDALTLLLIHAN
jgi:hypothetical protein